jgi:hypothetical protein
VRPIGRKRDSTARLCDLTVLTMHFGFLPIDFEAAGMLQHTNGPSNNLVSGADIRIPFA